MNNVREEIDKHLQPVYGRKIMDRLHNTRAQLQQDLSDSLFGPETLTTSHYRSSRDSALGLRSSRETPLDELCLPEPVRNIDEILLGCPASHSARSEIIALTDQDEFLHTNRQGHTNAFDISNGQNSTWNGVDQNQLTDLDEDQVIAMLLWKDQLF
jgi:hypothetical protein